MYSVRFPAQSNRASWPFTGLITDINDNPIDLTGLGLAFSIFDKRGWPRLLAQTSDGTITLIGTGQFRWFFTLQQMQTLRRDTYPCGMTMTTADLSQTIQVFTALLPIVDGFMPPPGDVIGGWGWGSAYGGGPDYG